MLTLFGKITAGWFTASYAAALVLELFYLFRPRPVVRLSALVLGGAGLLAHSLFVAVNPLPVETPYGSLILLAWVLAMFYLYGSLHHRRVAWGLFVLPLVLGLVLLAGLSPSDATPRTGAVSWEFFALEGKHFWPVVHGVLLLLAAIGVCVGFVASSRPASTRRAGCASSAWSACGWCSRSCCTSATASTRAGGRWRC
jgi:hypothetical protein